MFNKVENYRSNLCFEAFVSFSLEAVLTCAVAMAASRAKDGLFYSTAAVVLVSALVQTAYSQGGCGVRLGWVWCTVKVGVVYS